jgi:hypothetical protein
MYSGNNAKVRQDQSLNVVVEHSPATKCCAVLVLFHHAGHDLRTQHPEGPLQLVRQIQ